jgi:hypothetical protein
MEMGKASKSTKHAPPHDALPERGYPCNPDAEYYCKYDKIDGVWQCVEAHTQSGYYCPTASFEYDPPQCTDPAAVESLRESTSKSPKETASSHDVLHAGRHYCRYQHVGGGDFVLIQGCCGEGMYCPTDLEAYIDTFRGQGAWGKLLQVMLVQDRPGPNDGVFTEIVIDPVKVDGNNRS